VSTFWTATAAAAGAILAVLAVTQFVGRPLRKLVRDNAEFREDWYGQSARPGVAAQPGVMERLARIEGNTTSLPDRVSALEGRQTQTEHVINAHLAGHPPGTL
jgi:hypothetical protein